MRKFEKQKPFGSYSRLTVLLPNTLCIHVGKRREASFLQIDIGAVLHIYRESLVTRSATKWKACHICWRCTLSKTWRHGSFRRRSSHSRISRYLFRRDLAPVDTLRSPKSLGSGASLKSLLTSWEDATLWLPAFPEQTRPIFLFINTRIFSTCAPWTFTVDINTVRTKTITL